MKRSARRVVLMLASEHDLHADAVLLGLESKGVPVVRLDPESEWTESTSISLRVGSGGVAGELQHRGASVPLDSIGAVYCRSWNFLRAMDVDPIERHLRLHEMRAGLLTLGRTLRDRLWINEPWLEDAMEPKAIQAAAAMAHGLECPETLITSDPLEALRFWERCDGDIVIKQLSDVSLIDDSELACEDGVVYGFFTERVPREALEAGGESIRAAPVLLQRRVDKAADLRVTVVGERIFAHRIESQASAMARTDFRKDPGLRHAVVPVPAVLGSSLLGLVRSWGLHFAACDFVETPDGRLVFLEANPGGNWLWLEGPEEHPILESVVADLAQACARAPDRHQPS
jgi:hypothetical protein